jgi:hypothetical protein
MVYVWWSPCEKIAGEERALFCFLPERPVMGGGADRGKLYLVHAYFTPYKRKTWNLFALRFILGTCKLLETRIEKTCTTPQHQLLLLAIFFFFYLLYFLSFREAFMRKNFLANNFLASNVISVHSAFCCGNII